MRKFLFILFIACCSTSFAASYYISPTGSNSSGNGSINSPWASLSYACSAVTGSGNTIYVTAGNYTDATKCTWASGVNIESVGTHTIKVRHTTSDLNNGYIVGSGGSTAQYIKGLVLDGDNLAGDNAIIIYSRSNVTLENCTVKDFHVEGIRWDGTASNNKLLNCTISNSGGVAGGDRKYGLFFRGQTNMYVYRLKFNQILRSGANQTGDGIRYEDGNRGFLFDDCDFNGLYPAGEWTFLFEAWTVDKNTGIGYGFEMKNCRIVGEWDFGSGTYKGSYPYSVYIHDCVFGLDVTHGPNTYQTGLQFEEYCSDILVERCEFKNLDRGIYFCHNGTGGRFTNITVQYNKIHHVPYSYSTADDANGNSHGFGFGVVFAGSGSPSTITNARILNNTIVADPANPAGIGIWVDTRGTVNGVTVQNNIVYGFFEAAYITVGGGGSMSNVLVQKNMLWNNGNSNNLLVSGISVSNLVNDGGVKANPLLTSDYHLQSGSPAINTGMNLNLTTDKDGKAVGNPPEIGCYEYGTVVVPPYSTLGKIIKSRGNVIKITK